MIDRPALVAWRSKAPWPNVVQIEQDLLLSQLMIEIARDETLGPELVMRGGTCLHKLHLPTPLRYSEDLDYVRSTRGGIKPYTQALARIAEGVGLTVSSRQRSGQMVHVHFEAQPRSRPPGGAGRQTSPPSSPVSYSPRNCARSTNAARAATSSTSG